MLGSVAGACPVLSFEYRNEAGMHPGSIAFQHLCGLDNRQSCGVSIGNSLVAGLVSADCSVFLAKSIEVLVLVLEALHEEAKPLEHQASWAKTKVHVFEGLLDDIMHLACGEDIEILEAFTYLGSVVQNS